MRRKPGPRKQPEFLTHRALELHPSPCVRVFPVVVQGDGPIKDSVSLVTQKTRITNTNEAIC